MMKAISLLQPWASLTVLQSDYRKKFETRSWNTKHRGILAIHASKRFTPDLAALSTQTPFYEALEEIDIPLGAIIGIVLLENTCPTEIAIARNMINETEAAFGNYNDGRYAWHFPEAMPLTEPVECKGSLNVWTIPDDVLHEVLSDPAIDKFMRLLERRIWTSKAPSPEDWDYLHNGDLTPREYFDMHMCQNIPKSET